MGIVRRNGRVPGGRPDWGCLMQWPMLQRIEKQARRMREMMARLRVDPVALARARNGNAFAEARNRCVVCGATEECQRYLESSEGTSGAPVFCPNHQLFQSLEKLPEPDKSGS